MLDFNIFEPGQVHKSFKRETWFTCTKNDQFEEVDKCPWKVVFVGVEQNGEKLNWSLL